VRLHFITHTLLVCFLVSLSAPFVVMLVFRDLRPLVSESFIVSFFLSTGIALVSRLLVPPVIKSIGRPGWKLTLALSCTFIVSAAIGSLIGGALLLAIGLGTASQFWNNYFFLVRITAALAVVSGLGSHFYESLTSQLRAAQAQLKQWELEKERAERAALEAKLSSLESRIHPHFLFNTLNSISALISRNPSRAEELVSRLAALLRSSLNSTRQGLVPLESELGIVKDYLEIEKARFGDRLRYSLNLCDGTRQWMVPPFSVQSIVENSVKHGIAANENGGQIEITTEHIVDRLRVEIRDTGPGFNLGDVYAGHGLDNVIARLDTLFGAAASLEIEQRDDRCVVSLLIPAQPMQTAVR